MSTPFNSKLLNYSIKLLCTLLIIVASFVGALFFKADFPHLLFFILFILFYVLFPGLFLLRYADVKSPYTSVNLSLSFFIGFAFSVAVYFISDVLKNDLLLCLCGPVLSLSYCFRIVKKQTNPLQRLVTILGSIPTSFFVFFTLVFAYSIFTTQYTYIPPYAANFSSMRTDFGFHAGIINALAGDFPPRNPWISGFGIPYHLFTELLYSIPVRIFNLRSEEILLSCTPYVISPIICCSTYGFFREFMSNKDRSGLYCMSMILSNMFMIRAFAASWFLYHLCSNINNAGIGTAALFVLLILTKQFDTVEKVGTVNTIKRIVLLSVLVMLTTGIKGPIAIVYVSAMVGTVLLALVMRKINYGMLAASFISCISFFFIYIYILGSRGSAPSNGNGGSLLNPWEITDIFFLKDSIMGENPLTSVILFVTFLLFLFTAFTVPFVIGYSRELFSVLTKRKEYVFSKVMIYATCLVGLIALMLFNYNGHSQVYFGFASLSVVPAISYFYIEDIDIRCLRCPNLKAIKMAFRVCMCITSLTLVLHMSGYVTNSYNKYLERNSSTSLFREVSSHEYEGLIWLRDNTDRDAIIASDRYYSVPLSDYNYSVRSHNTHFGYATYSQRSQYLEGSGFSLRSSEVDIRKEMIANLEQMMDPENDNRDELARSLDIDYILVSKRFNDTKDLSNDNCKLVFTNEDVDIYEVEDAQ